MDQLAATLKDPAKPKKDRLDALMKIHIGAAASPDKKAADKKAKRA